MKTLVTVILILLLFYSQSTATELVTLCATNNDSLVFVGELKNTTYTLKVLLVEFSDIKHRNPNDDGLPEYTMADWNNHFFSQWSYISPNKTSPDNESVYGSMRDYFYLMSDGEFNMAGYILNHDNDEDGIPDWVVLPNTKAYYSNGSTYGFRIAAKSAASAAGFDPSTNSTTKLAIVYAGHTYREKANGQPGINGLHPHASGNEYISGERIAFGSPYNAERPDSKFCGIGMHCHEFGHVLGWPDTYRFYMEGRYIYKHDNGCWDLMAGGNYNGGRMHAPAPVNPQLRIEKGWVSPQVISSDITFDADYDLKDPEIFKIADSSDPDRYFLIENRHFEATMNFNRTVNYDYNHFTHWNWHHTRPDLPNQGILIWAHRKYTYSDRDPNNEYDPSWSYVIQADGFNNANTQQNFADLSAVNIAGDSGDPFPGFWNVKEISPWSFPSNLDIGPSPSTQLSQNVGFEITYMGNDYITIDLYYIDPEDASPGTPRFLQQVATYGQSARLTWNANTEPDLRRYRVYRKADMYPTWTMVGYATGTSWTDQEVIIGPPMTTWYWKIRAEDWSEKLSTYSNEVNAIGLFKPVVQNPDAENGIPENFKLAQNFPNPFNPETKISFDLPEDNFVNLVVYNIKGEKVVTLVNEPLAAGSYTSTLNASRLASGVYIYKITTGAFSATRRMLLIK